MIASTSNKKIAICTKKTEQLLNQKKKNTITTIAALVTNPNSKSLSNLPKEIKKTATRIIHIAISKTKVK